MYREWNISPEAWDEAQEEQNCMVTQLFLAVAERVNASSRKRSSDGAFVDADRHARAWVPKYTTEEWHTLTPRHRAASAPRKANLEGWPNVRQTRAIQATSPQEDGALNNKGDKDMQ